MDCFHIPSLASEEAGISVASEVIRKEGEIVTCRRCVRRDCSLRRANVTGKRESEKEKKIHLLFAIQLFTPTKRSTKEVKSENKRKQDSGGGRERHQGTSVCFILSVK